MSLLTAGGAVSTGGATVDRVRPLRTVLVGVLVVVSTIIGMAVPTAPSAAEEPPPPTEVDAGSFEAGGDALPAVDEEIVEDRTEDSRTFATDVPGEFRTDLYFNELIIQRAVPNLFPETRYSGGQFFPGKTGSGGQIPDAVLGGPGRDTPKAIFDLKSGFKGIEPGWERKLRSNLPAGTGTSPSCGSSAEVGA